MTDYSETAKSAVNINKEKTRGNLMEKSVCTWVKKNGTKKSPSAFSIKSARIKHLGKNEGGLRFKAQIKSQAARFWHSHSRALKNTVCVVCSHRNVHCWKQIQKESLHSNCLHGWELWERCAVLSTLRTHPPTNTTVLLFQFKAPITVFGAKRRYEPGLYS